ncbi:MAG: helix-turn-helix transcriptional regulator [Anaeroplasmataceae bacterium]|jgi:Predicted transcriptional regulators|nr:helix-turn-helix transcriptional regulator [Anaeroplasmataceae bacterium]HRF69974.1 helix-turn-helix transcriptional regulator [Candidatus Pelethenecus sp.]
MGKQQHSEEELEFLRDFGLQVKRLRNHFKLTQEELAFRMNMTTQTLSDIENGKSDCQQTTSFLISRALGIHMCELYKF